MAKNWWEADQVADDGNFWEKDAPLAEPSLKDQLFSTATKLFDSAPAGSVMENVDPALVQEAWLNKTPAERQENAARAAQFDKMLATSTGDTISSIRGPEPSVGSIISGLANSAVVGARKTRAGLRQMVGDVIDSKHLQDQARREVSGANLQNDMTQPEIEDPTARGVYGGASSLIQQVPAIAAAILTRNPTIATGTAVAPILPQQYGEYRAAGVAPLKALPAAGAYAATEYITERLPMGVMISKFGKAGTASFLGELLAKDLPGEQVATLVQDAIDQATLHPEKTWGEYLAERPDAAYQTLIATLTQSGIMGGANAAINRYQNRQQNPVPLPAALTPAPQQTAPAAAAVEPAPAPQDIAALSDAIASTATIPSKLETPAVEAPWEADPVADQVDMEALRTAAQANPPVARGDDADTIGRAESAPKPAAQPAPAVNASEAEREAADRAAGLNNEGDPIGGADTPASLEPKFEVPAQLTERATQLETAREGLRPGDIVAADGNPFKTKAQAAREARPAGPGWQVKKGGGGFVVRYQPQTAAQVAHTKRLQQQQNQVDPDRDSMFAAVAKLGGIRNDQLTKEWGYDPKEIRTIRGAGIKRIATKNGMSLDRMGEALAELGYLSYDEHGKHDLSELFDLFDGELRGSKHYTPQGFERVYRQMEEARIEELSQNDINASGLDDLSDDARDAIEELLDEYPDIDAEEDARIAAAIERAWNQPVASVGPEAGETAGRAKEASDRSAGETGQDAPRESGEDSREADDARSRQYLSGNDRQDTDGSQNVEQRQDSYTADMFGVQLQDSGRRPVAQPPESKRPEDLDTADAIPTGSRFASRTELVTENTRQLGIDRVSSVEDAAKAMSYLGRGAVERLDALVTDREGKPLAIVGAFKGALSQASVFPATIAGEAFRVHGAANIWFAHNHPGGSTDLSTADKRLYDALRNVFAGSKISPRGLFAIAGNVEDVRDWEFTDGDGIQRGTATATNTSATVPVVERQYKQVGTLGPAINSPQAAKAMAVDLAAGQSGVVLMDVRLRPLAFIPVEVAAPLRMNGRMDALYRAISIANSGSAVIVNNGRHTDDAIKNLAGLLTTVDSRVLDVIDTSTGRPVSWAEEGKSFGDGTFYSRGKGKGMSAEDVRSAIADDIYGHDVDVYDTMADAPEYVRIQAGEEGGGDVEGFWDLAKNKVALIASNIDSPQRAREVARHELIGHYGLENMLADSADPGEMARLVKRVLKAEKEGNKVILDLAAQVDRSQPNLDDERRAKEIIAIMAERNIQNSITKRVLDLIRQFLKKIGFLKTDTTDADIAKMLREAREYLRDGTHALMGTAAEPAFSRSAMKSVDANIARGKDALNKALLDKTSVRRAMYRNDIGWIDFEWGDSKKGIAHILQQRVAKDGMSEADATRFLTENLVDVIARGQIERRIEHAGAVNLRIAHRGDMAVLVRNPGSNAWMLTGFEIRPSGGKGAGFDAPNPTQAAPTPTRRGQGADGDSTLNQNDSSGNGAAFSRAYHGSPHRFDKFSLEKIGTGEGAQAYGWGLYFAGKKEIAEHYRKGLSTRDFINKAREAYDEFSSPDEAVDALLEIDGLSEPQKELIEALREEDWLGFDYPHQAIAAAIKNPEQWDLTERARAALDKQGQLYEVEIPDDHEYLLWDKPLSEQPQEVKVALDDFLAEFGDFYPTVRDSMQGFERGNTTGEALYRAFVTDSGTPKRASGDLHRLGIAGIKYLDGTSRNRPIDQIEASIRVAEKRIARLEKVGDPDLLNEWKEKLEAAREELKNAQSYNYVVFDDNRVSVEKTHYSRRDQADDEQGNLDLSDGSKHTPMHARDFVSTQRDVSGRRRWVAGQKGYDRLVDAINPLLAKVKLSNDAPDAFKQMMRQFQIDQNRALENAKRVAEVGTQTLTPEERILISDIIEKNASVGDLPPENVAKIAADIGAALKQQAQELVDLGMASPERLIENYLPRAYRNPLLARLTNKEMFASWYQKAKLRMNGNRLKSRGLVDTVDMKDIEKYQKLGWHLSGMSDGTDIPDDLWDAIQTKGKIPPQYTKDLKFLMWRDYTEDERAQMGEIRDGILRYAMGYTETQRDIAIGRLFKAIAENDELSSAINPGGWARVPDQEIPGTGGLKRYGALSGLFVPPYIRDVIERSTQPKGPLMQMYDKALSFWKEGKTVWNPVSHGNNIVSNVFVMHYAGLNPADPRPWRATVREYRTKGQYYREAIDNGLFGTEFASKDIQELFLPDLTDDLDVETVVASRFNKVVEALKKAGKPISFYRDKMQKAYEFEDQFFKLMIFADRRKAGASIEDAIKDTERYIFNYSDIPEGVELAKRVYSPFISYTYKALPMLVHTAMTRPDRLLLPIMLLGGANWLAYAITGGDEEKERKGMPEYLQGRTAIGTPKALRMPFDIGDRPAFLDMSRRVPLGDLFDLTNQTGGLSVPAPMMPSHPLFTATAALLFNIDTFTGKPVTQNSDTAWETAQKRASWAWKQMAPNAPFVPGSWNFDKLMNGAANAFDTEMMGYTGYTKAGDPVPFATALLDVSTGTKIRSFDPERGIDFKEYQMDKERKEIQANIRSAMRNKSMTPEARRDYVERQQEKLSELQAKRAELR